METMSCRSCIKKTCGIVGTHIYFLALLLMTIAVFTMRKSVAGTQMARLESWGVDHHSIDGLDWNMLSNTECNCVPLSSSLIGPWVSINRRGLV